jgi:peptide/nickel transport system permease protein
MVDRETPTTAQNHISEDTLPDHQSEVAELYSSKSQWRMAWNSMRRDKAAILGAVIILLVLLMILLAPIISPQDPIIQSDDPADYLAPPSLEHLMGTDDLRRDILSRILHGGRTTLQAGFFSVLAAAAVGIVLGMVAGFYGGRVDEVIGRLIDIVLAIPGILLAIAIIAILGPGLQNAMLAVAIGFIPTFARLVRGVTFTEINKDYILAARAVGGTNWHIIRRHVLRNVVAPVIVIGTLTIASAIQIAAALSFLGLGAQPPSPEWGAMLSNGRNFMRTGEWWMYLFPGAAIFLIVLAINLFGDGLRDALDPRLRNIK